MARVLIIEDNPANMKLASLLLLSAGHAVLRAVDAEAGLTLASAEPADVILMDVQLPGIDGLGATALLKKDPATAAIPVIALTAMAMKEDREKSRVAGCDAYIAKPLRYQELYAAIDTLLATGGAVSAQRNKSRSLDAMSSSTATILIVDDEIQGRKLLEAQLRPEGYVTLGAASGEEALASIAQHAPDLILLDIMMPDMDGYQVASILKANPATSTIPIIMVTVQSDRSARLAGLNAGAEEFLTKPVERAELLLRVRNLLRLKEFSDFLQNHSSILERQVQARTVDLQRFRTAMDATADAILLVNRTTMRFVEVNAGACTMLGYTREELFQPRPPQITTDPVELLEGAYDAIIAGHNKNELTETLWRRKDGSQFPVEVRRDAHLSGAAWIIVGVARDIPERKPILEG